MISFKSIVAGQCATEGHPGAPCRNLQNRSALPLIASGGRLRYLARRRSIYDHAQPLGRAWGFCLMALGTLERGITIAVQRERPVKLCAPVGAQVSKAIETSATFYDG